MSVDVTNYLGFAAKNALRVSPFVTGDRRDDLIADGFLGLVEAAHRFRGDRGVPFTVYARRRIRGTVQDALRARDPLTREQRRAVRNGAPDPSPAICSIDEIGDVAAAGTSSTSSPRTAALFAAVRRLPASDRKTLALIYGRGMTLREAGAEIGISESGVCRRRARALARLRTELVP